MEEEGKTPQYAPPSHQTEEENDETEEHNTFPINDRALLDKIYVIPNPTTGELRITNYGLRITDVEVFDIYGRKLSSYHLITSSSNHKIDISHLQSGIYFVKIITEEGEIVKKVIKQ